MAPPPPVRVKTTSSLFDAYFEHLHAISRLVQVNNAKSRVASGGLLTALSASRETHNPYPLTNPTGGTVPSVVLSSAAVQSSPDRNASGNATRHKRPSSTAEELFGLRPRAAAPQPTATHAKKKMKPTPPLAPAPARSAVLNPMHNTANVPSEPEKSSTRAPPRASYPGALSVKHEDSSSTSPAVPHDSTLRPPASEKSAVLSPRVSLPATLPVTGGNVSPTPSYRLPSHVPPLSSITRRSDAAVDMYGDYAPKPRYVHPHRYFLNFPKIFTG